MAGADDGPETIGPYRVSLLLREDDTWQTYHAMSPRFQPVELSVMAPAAVADAAFRQRFARDAAAAAAIASPNLVSVLDADTGAPRPWVVTEDTLRSQLPLLYAVYLYGPLPGSSVLVLAAGLAEALRALHAAGLPHRRVQPEAVLLTGRGPKLAGLFGALDADPDYASPEQAAGGPPGPASDIFSLGKVLTFAAGRDAPSDALPAEIADIVRACLEPDPARRPDAAQLAARLSGIRLPGRARDWLPERLARDVEPPAPVEPAGHAPGSLPPATSPAPAGPPLSPVPEPQQPAQSGSPPGGHGYGEAPAYPPPAPTPRYLKGHCPQTVRAGEPFSVLASVVVAAPEGAAALKSFDVGPHGRDVLLVLHAPGLQVLGPQRQTVRVPPDGDSEPVMFELRADAPGPRKASITAWADGTYLGQLDVETTATRWAVLRRGHQDVTAEIGTEPVTGAVSLVVRHDPRQNSYRFEFRDEDNPEEVVSDLAYEPGRRVEHLVAGLDRLAKGRSGYSAAESRDYLVNAGAALWAELLPARLREQFWDRQHRIRQLTILAESDVVPWELLYPLDPGHDHGFLVEQFPVTRVVFGRRPARSLRLDPAWFVLPGNSPPRASEEVTAMLNLFYPSLGVSGARPPVVYGLTPLLDLIKAGDFGLLHFACHNAFDPVDGSSILLDKRQFTPTQLTTAAIGQVLARTGPTVFINACRSAGASPSYHRLDSWARKFLDAGAAAFIGSLWAVRDSSARDFAAELYRLLRAGDSLGDAAMAARRAAAAEPGDPTWLAYAVYGDPRATLRD